MASGSDGHWEWQDEHNNWNPYRSGDQEKIKAVSSGNGICNIEAGSNVYIVDTRNNVQTNHRYHTQRPIRFVPAPSSSSLFSSFSPSTHSIFSSSSGVASPAVASASTGKWNCGVCTFENNAGRFDCEMCGTPNPAVPSAPGKWNCPVCTFINNATDLCCTVCNQGLNPNVKDDEPEPVPISPAPVHPPFGGSGFGPPGGGFGFDPHGGYGGGYGPPVPRAVPKRGGPVPRHSGVPKKKRKIRRSKKVAAPSENLFVDPAEYERKQKQEEAQRLRKETEEGRNQIQIFEMLLGNRLSENEIIQLLQKECEEAPGHQGDVPMQTEQYEMCQICYCPFEDDDPAITIPTCGHVNSCRSCTKQYCESRIKDDDIMPWIPCPFPECRAKIPPDILMQIVDAEYILEFLTLLYHKKLQRNSLWVNCKTDKCRFGFLIQDEQKHTKTCPVCSKRQNVSRAAVEDESIKELLKSGAMRKCPKCNDLTMKDYGICNVIQCGKCQIWWNWNTRETGTSQRELKLRAKNNGTLWQPGELAYQQKLQQQDPEAFAKLLEKNGIKYDPNYRRGAW